MSAASVHKGALMNSYGLFRESAARSRASGR